MAQIETISAEIEGLDHSIKMHAKTSEETQLMQTMPGVGPMSAIAILAFCPPANNFRTGRDFAAWLGLVPRQHSTGGKERLGRITKMGQKDVRRLLIIGAMSVINSIERWKRCAEPWLARMLESRPRMVVAVALANRMARRLWAMLMTGQTIAFAGPSLNGRPTDTGRYVRTKGSTKESGSTRTNEEKPVQPFAASSPIN